MLRVKYFLLSIVITLLSISSFSQTSPGGVLTSSNCKLWLDARDLDASGSYTNNPTVGTAVSSWNDKSGNANNLTQAAASARPTYSQNGSFNSVKFDNSGTNINFMTATTQQMLTPGTMYFVINATNVGDGANCLFDRATGANTSIRFAQWNGVNRIGFTKYSVSDYQSTIAPTYGANVILSYLKTSGSDNVDITQNATNNVVTIGSANPGLPLYVLGKNSGNDGMNSQVMEILAYDVDLNRVQRDIIDNYLSAKYGGISIPNDRYAGDDPANGNYDFEVCGIGRLNNTNINASVASSISGGLGVTQGTNLSNNEYLLFGHTSAPNSLNRTDVGGMSAGPNKGRWERVWYLDWTHSGGSTETVNLTFDYSDAGAGGAPIGPNTNYKLLYRAGQSGNWTEVMNASAIGTDRVTFNAVPYTVGDGYYTIGSLDYLNSPLPLKLISFDASVCEKNVCLNWVTASEENTSRFIVQRNFDGQNWLEVANVKAAGNSYSKLHYETIDNNNPLKVISYYRLMQYDIDETYTISPIIAVNPSNDLNDFFIYPNPNNGDFTIELSNKISFNNLKVELIDERGSSQFVSNYKIKDFQFENKIHIKSSGVKPGVYVCKLEVDEDIYYAKVIINGIILKNSW